MDSIEKLRLKNENILKQLIQTHLSFIIDIDFEQDFGEHKNINNKKKINTNSTIFGSNLTQQGICSVNQLIEFINKDINIKQEGIFRKSGSSLRQLELRNLISLGITVDLDANRFTVHDCCSVLKKFISELPEPLLTESHFQLFSKIPTLRKAITSPNKITAKKLTAIQLLLLLIPSANRQLLHELLNLFEKILKHSNNNKMNSSSLATIFAPHLFCPRNFTAIELQTNLNVITDVLIFMIDNSSNLLKVPKQLLTDVEKQLEILSKTASTSSLAPVNSAHQFCVQANEQQSEDFTARQVAELYAYIQSMPQSGTPQKKKWIKRFNRENGKGTPLLKQTKSDSAKNLKSSIGDVLKAGHNFFAGKKNPTDSSSESPKSKRPHKSLFKGSDDSLTGDQSYKKFSPIISQNNLLQNESFNDSNELNDLNKNDKCVTPLGMSLVKANKQVRASLRKIGNREPIVM